MRIAWLLAVGLLGGCGLTLDLDPPDRPGIDGGARDSGAPEDARARPDAGASPCEGAQDGTVCDEAGRICLDGQCVRSRCGDGFVHAAAGEECEDGNELSGDGCEPSCRHTCESNSDCAVTDARCAAVSCAEHVCASALAPDGTTCAIDATLVGRCHGGACIPATCGDGQHDSGEACDDGNAVAGDGCEPDCSLICDASGCSDGVECNGLEVCLLETSEDGEQPRARCMAGEPPDMDDCEECDPLTGRTRLIDEDGDGYAAGSHPGCEGRDGDCAPDDPSVHPGAPDFMLGDGVDNDCDGSIDEDPIVNCFADEDGDGFGAGRSLPVSVDALCPDGTVPGGPTMAVDCDDGDPDVFPDQTAWFNTSRCAAGEPVPAGTLCWDYNCDGLEEQRWPRPASCLAVLDRTCNDQGWSLLDGVLVPACGQPGAWTMCASVLGLGCVPGTSISRPVQECH